MKKFFIWLMMIMMICSKTSADPIPIRGIVEGFYGTPYTNENRIDLFKFCNAHNLNSYIYAPKDDPYHRAKWRESYPQQKLDEIKNLIQSAKSYEVKFIFAVSPGLDLNYSDEDLNFMIKKLSAIYDLGCRDFAIFFDDIKDKDGQSQAKFLNRVEEHFVNVHENISPLITVPTEYFRLDMIDEFGRKPYTDNFVKNLSKNILVLYTGEGVVQPILTDENYQAANQIYENNLGIWWNYPVNDYMESKLALGAIDNLPKNSNIPAIFFNPMKFQNLSKISLATGADYANDPKNYNPSESWNNAINEQFKNLADDMKLFASHSQHLKNNWADIGDDDGKILRKSFDELLNNPNEKNFKSVEDQLKSLKVSIKNLQKNLPKNILNECQPQLEQFNRIVDADLFALKVLKDKNKSEHLRRMIDEINLNEDTAKISDECAKKFLNEVLKACE